MPHRLNRIEAVEETPRQWRTVVRLAEFLPPVEYQPRQTGPDSPILNAVGYPLSPVVGGVLVPI